MSGLNWKRAKFNGSNAADLLDEKGFRERDAAARWLKEAEAKQARRPSAKPGRAKRRKPVKHKPRATIGGSSGLVIYTDGACEPNPGKGGWAFVVYRDGEEVHSDCGGDLHATNNVMEMMAVIKALEWLLSAERRGFARVFSDSQYVVKGCNEWRKGWKKRDWQRVVDRQSKRLEPIKNVGLWKRIDGLLMIAPVKIEWVKGHAGVIGNERADSLSQDGRDAAIAAAAGASLIEEQLRYSI